MWSTEDLEKVYCILGVVSYLQIECGEEADIVYCVIAIRPKSISSPLHYKYT